MVVVLLNETHEPTDELIIEQYNGSMNDVSDVARECISSEELSAMRPGDWIIIVDGECVGAGAYAPSFVHINL